MTHPTPLKYPFGMRPGSGHNADPQYDHFEDWRKEKIEEMAESLSDDALTRLLIAGGTDHAFAELAVFLSHHGATLCCTAGDGAHREKVDEEYFGLFEEAAACVRAYAMDYATRVFDGETERGNDACIERALDERSRE